MAAFMAVLFAISLKTMPIRYPGPYRITTNWSRMMESLDYHDPVTGVDVLMSPENHAATSGIVISQVRSGGWQTVHVVEQ